jgi:hypothetical protein
MTMTPNLLLMMTTAQPVSNIRPEECLKYAATRSDVVEAQVNSFEIFGNK